MNVKIIAEMSANHNHDINNAKKIILAAKNAGADAVKLQTYTADTMTIDCDNEYFQITQGTLWDGTTLYKLYQQAYTPWEWHEELFSYGKSIGVEMFSTPFDITAVDYLEALDCPIYKIASFEITDIPLIEYLAAKGKPIIISVGIATLEEIAEAVIACRNMGNNNITLLQCTSQYPSKVEDARLSVMVDLKERFNVKVGLSDHTMGHEAAVLAVAMGAEIIEKHFTFDKSLVGPDAAFSMNPAEFAEMVKQIRRVEQIVGNPGYEFTEQKRKNRTFARSLFVVKDVKVGDAITLDNVRPIRPGYGLAPKHLVDIMGKRFNKNVQKGSPLCWEMVEK